MSSSFLGGSLLLFCVVFSFSMWVNCAFERSIDSLAPSLVSFFHKLEFLPVALPACPIIPGFK